MNKITKITFFAGVIALLSGSTAFAATNDYVNYWKFDEGGGRSVGDSAGLPAAPGMAQAGGQNGVLFGTSTGFGWASGKVGTAIGMDGAAGTGIALPNAFLSGSQGTISLWLNMNVLADRNIIFSAKSTTDNNVYAALAVDRDGRPVFQFRDTANANDRKAQATRLLNRNEWYNLVLTANGLSYHVYVNGEEMTVAGDNIGRWFPDITNQTWSYRIGTLDAIPMNGSFNGFLDDLRIYNRVLSVDEITALYAEGNAAVPTVPASVAPKITFTISSDHIQFGGSVILTWSTVNIDSCTASGSWSDTVGTSGTKVAAKLVTDAMYTLTCAGKYGKTDTTVKVAVDKETATTTPTTTLSGLGLTVTSLTTGSLTSTTSPLGSGLTVVSLMNGSSMGAMPKGLANAAWKRSLKVGSTGEDVTSLQLFLIRHGFLADGNAIGLFGPRTKSALMQFQKTNGIAVVGIFGPITRAKVSEMNTEQ